MKLPASLMHSLVDVEGFNKEAFEKVHASGEQVTSIRVNPSKPISQFPNFPISKSNKVPWTDYGFYLESRPSFTFDPLFHAGCYYVQEASSMFVEQALKQTIDLSRHLKILDLAAAPGGKSTHIQSLISKDSLLVSNEVIRSRANILQDNIIKWGSENVVVTNNDPRDFARLENYFDVIVVDAPCSGSGLFRRDEDAIEQWSLSNVQLCNQRQQRILADAWPALKKNGILIYSTCSYSKEEDEEIVDWMKKEFKIGIVDLRIDEEWNIVETLAGYRFWPYNVKGEGFFIVCVRKLAGEEQSSAKSKAKLEFLDKKETELVQKWVNINSRQLVKYRNNVYAVPQGLVTDINSLAGELRVNYFGVRVGGLVREKMIPDHALAMSDLVSDEIEKIELDLKNAITYLQKRDLNVPGLSKGWKLVTYQGFSLGWINVLDNRINNYYPKALRILKDI
jgi:16S rRNA C967 or C1407 C5-methylase (RsmB/RsmF family)/NOL1/NOP2/fmu family ribosome biogenesis protein